MRLVRALARRLRARRHRPADAPAEAAFPLLAGSLGRDPLLLNRLPREQARRLSDTVLAASTNGDRSPQVDAAIRTFRAADATPADARPRSLGLLLADLALARAGEDGLALHAAIELGPDALPAHARAATLAALALADVVAVQRGRQPPVAADAARSDAACRAALAAIGAVHAAHGTLPFEPARSDDPRRPEPDGAVPARDTWRDAALCAALLGPARPPLWNAARDAAAFALLLLHPSSIGGLAPQEAACLAGDATRAGRLVLRHAPPRPVAEAARRVLVTAGCVAA